MTKVTLAPGDGIGPEICESVVTLFAAAKVDVSWERVDIGMDQYMKSGELLPQRYLDSVQETRISLKGPTTTPVGKGHKSINVTIRQALDLYACDRPVKSIPGIVTPYENVDMLIVRENSEDLYRGIEYKVSDNVAHGIKLITKDASAKIGKHAFELARKLKRTKVTCVHKANIMKITDGMFLESIREVSSSYPEIKFEEMIVDNCCMQMVTRPQQFDVIVTENLYGDILSDLGAGLIGGLGVAAGANIGDRCAVFEATHGSAPDISGKDLANPTAIILSSLMLLEHLGDFEKVKIIETALFKTLSNKDTRTKDLGGPLGTRDFTKQIISNLK
ncbi:MAG: isocitrate/isopropylmalate dehydrogenase family protein [Oligoflexales bacterium]